MNKFLQKYHFVQEITTDYHIVCEHENCSIEQHDAGNGNVTITDECDDCGKVLYDGY